MSEQYWFNPIFDECHNISDIAYDLKDLAKAFLRVGNSTLYNELSEVIIQLSASEEVIRRQAGMHVNEDFKQSEESTKNVVFAALAGIGIAKAEDKS